MIRALFRLLSMVALAIAVIMAVLDATRSILADELVMTPLGSSWMAVSSSTLEVIEEMFLRNLPDYAWDPVMIQFLSLPGFAVFACLSLLFHILGRPRRKRRAQFAAEM